MDKSCSCHHLKRCKKYLHSNPQESAPCLRDLQEFYLSPCAGGSLNYTFGGDQTMQMHGDFQEFTLPETNIEPENGGFQ